MPIRTRERSPVTGAAGCFVCLDGAVRRFQLSVRGRGLFLVNWFLLPFRSLLGLFPFPLRDGRLQGRREILAAGQGGNGAARGGRLLRWRRCGLLGFLLPIRLLGRSQIIGGLDQAGIKSLAMPGNQRVLHPADGVLALLQGLKRLVVKVCGGVSIFCQFGENRLNILCFLVLGLLAGQGGGGIILFLRQHGSRRRRCVLRSAIGLLPGLIHQLPDKRGISRRIRARQNRRLSGGSRHGLSINR